MQLTDLLRASVLFDDAYEQLVTDGRAADYAALVDRYRLKYAALNDNDSRCADRMRAAADGDSCATLVDAARRAEEARFELHVEIQVLRQRLSVAALDGPEKAEIADRLSSRPAHRPPRARSPEAARRGTDVLTGPAAKVTAPLAAARRELRSARPAATSDERLSPCSQCSVGSCESLIPAPTQ